MSGLLRMFRDSVLVAFSIFEMGSFSHTLLPRNLNKNHPLALKSVSERRKRELEDGKSINSRVSQDYTFQDINSICTAMPYNSEYPIKNGLS
jgi:hypothetical protein